MLACLRGSSDDRLDGRRSAERKTRLKQPAVHSSSSYQSHHGQGHNRSHSRRSYGSVGNGHHPTHHNHRQQHQHQQQLVQLAAQQLPHQQDLYQLHQQRQRSLEREVQLALRHRDHSLEMRPDQAFGAQSMEILDAPGPYPMNGNWDGDHVLGMDRTWEAERNKGLNMLYRAVEKSRGRGKERDRERRSRGEDRHEDRGRSRYRRHRRGRYTSRQRQAGHSARDGREGRTGLAGLVDREEGGYLREQWVMGGDHPDPSGQEILLEPTPTLVGQAPKSVGCNQTASLEHQVDELTQMLDEERQLHRRDKLSMAKLQQELSRTKSDGPLREALMEELDRERSRRSDVENRLKVVTFECESSKERADNLQMEIKKLELNLRSLASYKQKIESLKHEKATLIRSYESRVTRYQEHAKSLEHESRVLISELKDRESEARSQDIFRGVSDDSSYNTKVVELREREEKEPSRSALTERLKVLEAENTKLVAENEKQKQQYEKCLDSIANQVVQALLTQKGLREECRKLQTRVVDLEHQNQQLNKMFKQQIQTAPEGLLQSAIAKLQRGRAGVGSDNDEESSSLQSPVLSGQMSPPKDDTGECQASYPPSCGHTGSAHSLENMVSIHSVCTDYNENTHDDCDLGRPEMSSPPSWLLEKLQGRLVSSMESMKNPSVAELHPELLNTEESDMESQHGETQQPGLLHNGQTTCEQVDQNVLASGVKNTACDSRDEVSNHVSENEQLVSAGLSVGQAFTICGNVCLSAMQESKTTTHRDEINHCNEITTEIPANAGRALGMLTKDLLGGETEEDQSVCKSLIKSGSAHKRPGLNQPVGSNSKCTACEQMLSDSGTCSSCTADSALSPTQELLSIEDAFDHVYLVNGSDGLLRVEKKLLEKTRNIDVRTPGCTAKKALESAPSNSTSAGLNNEECDNHLQRKCSKNKFVGSKGIKETTKNPANNDLVGCTDTPAKDNDINLVNSILSKSAYHVEKKRWNDQGLDSKPIVLNNGTVVSKLSPVGNKSALVPLEGDLGLLCCNGNEGDDEIDVPNKLKFRIRKSGPHHNCSLKENDTRLIETSCSTRGTPNNHKNVLNYTKSVTARGLDKNKFDPPAESIRRTEVKPHSEMCPTGGADHVCEACSFKPEDQRPEVDGQESPLSNEVSSEGEPQTNRNQASLAGNKGQREDEANTRCNSQQRHGSDCLLKGLGNSGNPELTCLENGHTDDSVESVSSPTRAARTVIDKLGDCDDTNIKCVELNKIPLVLKSIDSTSQSSMPSQGKWRSSDSKLDESCMASMERKCKSSEWFSEQCEDLPVDLKSGHAESWTDVEFIPSIDRRSIGRVKEIKMLFESKLEERLQKETFLVRGQKEPTKLTLKGTGQTQCNGFDIHHNAPPETLKSKCINASVRNSTVESSNICKSDDICMLDQFQRRGRISTQGGTFDRYCILHVQKQEHRSSPCRNHRNVFLYQSFSRMLSPDRRKIPRAQIKIGRKHPAESSRGSLVDKSGASNLPHVMATETKPQQEEGPMSMKRSWSDTDVNQYFSETLVSANCIAEPAIQHASSCSSVGCSICVTSRTCNIINS